MHLTYKTLILCLFVVVPLLAIAPTASQSFTTITTLTTITTQTISYGTSQSTVGTTHLTSATMQTVSNTLLNTQGIPIVYVYTVTSMVTSTLPVYGTQTRTIIANSTQTLTVIRTEEAAQQIGLGQGGLVAGAVLAVLIVGFALFVARRKHGKAVHGATESNLPPTQAPTTSEAGEQRTRTVSTAQKLKFEAKPVEETISTGYAELDQMLSGGLPAGYVIGIVSASFDERDLIVRKIIGSALSSGRAVFYVTSESGRAENLARTYRENFYAFYPEASQAKVEPTQANVIVIPRIANLSDLNITLNKAIAEKAPETQSKLLVLDILSDLLLVHKSVTTRRWLVDFVGRRKAQGFTVLATLNPLIASKEEVQTIVDFFDGVIEIYEKEMRERSRRFLVIKKMYARRYSENELMLDKDKLF